MKQSSKNALKNDPSATELRQQRIAEIRKQLAEGTYEISADKIATALMKHMQEKEETKDCAA